MVDDSEKLTGGCLCGNIRYTAHGKPLSTVLCHCESCRRVSGSAFSVNAVFPESAVEITGELSVFEDQGDSGHPVLRYFCNRCGAPVRSAAKATQGLFVVKAGTLDEPHKVAPTAEYYSQAEVPGWRGPHRKFDTTP